MFPKKWTTSIVVHDTNTHTHTRSRMYKSRHGTSATSDTIDLLRIKKCEIKPQGDIWICVCQFLYPFSSPGLMYRTCDKQDCPSLWIYGRRVPSCSHKKDNRNKSGLCELYSRHQLSSSDTRWLLSDRCLMTLMKEALKDELLLWPPFGVSFVVCGAINSAAVWVKIRLRRNGAPAAGWTEVTSFMCMRLVSPCSGAKWKKKQWLSKRYLLWLKKKKKHIKDAC